VRVTGTLEDVRPVLAGAGVFALAFRAASGIRSRASEVMALEVPVVAYPDALQGMEFEAGRDYLAARDPEEFGVLLAHVLASPELGARIGGAGRAQVARVYAKDRIYGAFADIYEELLGSSRRS
jgi:glycosyltransferase involved in cell wall biosynthesis